MIERFKYSQKEIDALMKSIVILVDSREQKIDHITQYFDAMKIAWKVQKLDTLDYSFYLPANPELGITRDLYFDKEIGVERKANLDELAGNFTKERDRIKKELVIAPPKKILIIENASYADMVYGRYQSSYNAKSYFGTVHSWWHEFDIPFVFMEDPKLTGLFIIGYFQYHLRNLVK